MQGPTTFVLHINIPKFPLGKTVISANAAQCLDSASIQVALKRHECGDWGELEEDDRLENERSLKEGFRLLSVFRSASGVRFYVITEADRSSTCVLLPEDY